MPSTWAGRAAWGIDRRHLCRFVDEKHKARKPGGHLISRASGELLREGSTGAVTARKVLDNLHSFYRVRRHGWQTACGTRISFHHGTTSIFSVGDCILSCFLSVTSDIPLFLDISGSAFSLSVVDTPLFAHNRHPCLLSRRTHGMVLVRPSLRIGRSV